jgi:chromosome partitioning protein
MAIITIASSKGGTSKTTLSACLAVHVSTHENFRVGMVDLDPQQSLAEWFQRRKDKGKLLKMFKAIGDAAEWADIVIVDTPPALVDVIAEAIGEADFVLIPARPSSLDALAVDVVLDIVRKHRTPFGFVLTSADERWKITKGTKEALLAEDGGDVCDGVIGIRPAYASAMTVGKTGPESVSERAQAKACAEEIETLWNFIRPNVVEG